MQAKKAKQLLKARLTRERQVYEMRKRAELKAAVAELERPWEAVEDRAPKLFSVSADEQLKVLADRFQRSGGFDMWSERDGPQLFTSVDGLPSNRFFPKGVVHSTKPYGRIGENMSGAEIASLPGSFSELEDDTNGYKSSGGFGDIVSSEGQIKTNRWTENTVNSKERRGTDGKFRNKPYKKIGINSNFAEKLSLPCSVSDVEDHIVRNGYKNFDGVMNSVSSEPLIKANKWIKSSRDEKEKIGSNGKVKNNPSKIIGKISNVAKSSSQSSVSEVEDDIARKGYKNLDRFRGSLTNEGQTKANKWTKNPMDRKEKFGSNGKLRNKHFEKFMGNANGPQNLSSPRSFYEFDDHVERNGYKNSDTFRDSSSREGHIRANQSTRISACRTEKSYSNGNFTNKGSSRKFQFEKSNTFDESRGLSSEVYDMDLRDDGSYGFESENW